MHRYERVRNEAVPQSRATGRRVQEERARDKEQKRERRACFLRETFAAVVLPAVDPVPEVSGSASSFVGPFIFSRLLLFASCTTTRTCDLRSFVFVQSLVSVVTFSVPEIPDNRSSTSPKKRSFSLSLSLFFSFCLLSHCSTILYLPVFESYGPVSIAQLVESIFTFQRFDQSSNESSC